jgi:hypothetical protein
MKLKSKSDGYIGLPIMFFIIRQIVAPRVQQQPLTLVWQMETKVSMVLEPLEVMELSRLWCKGIH